MLTTMMRDNVLKLHTQHSVNLHCKLLESEASFTYRVDEGKGACSFRPVSSTSTEGKKGSQERVRRWRGGEAGKVVKQERAEERGEVILVLLEVSSKQFLLPWESLSPPSRRDDGERPRPLTPRRRMIRFGKTQ